MNSIKLPSKCSDEELHSILTNAEARGYELPYSREEGRYLKIEDYLAEQLLRDRKPDKKSATKSQELNIVLNMLNSHDPDFYILFSDAIRSCQKTQKPVEVSLQGYVAARRYTAMQLFAAKFFRTAMRRYAKCTLVAMHADNIWLLPPAISAHDWILEQGGFVKASRLKSDFPRAFSVFERLAGATHRSDDRCFFEKIDDSEKLLQIVNILAVYSRYYTVEDLFRVEFAFGRNNLVMARTLVYNPPEFIAFISPTQSSAIKRLS